MRLTHPRRHVAIAGLAVAMLGCGSITAAFAAGPPAPPTPPAPPAAPAGPVLYSSLVHPTPPDWWSLSFSATEATEVGDKINLAKSAPLQSATVIMDSESCGNGGTSGTPPCTTTPGATFPESITFTIYAPGPTEGTVGSVLASDQESFNIPYRPSSSVSCNNVPSIFPGPPNLDGNEWFDPATGTCYYGITYAATFDHFTFTGSRTLPRTVVYGISYDGASPSASPGAQGLNVLYSTESASGAVPVGSDTDPGNLYASARIDANGLGGSGGQITCAAVGTTFQEYNTALGPTCGPYTNEGSGAPNVPIAFVPAVQING